MAILSKINKIKNLGLVFADFTCSQATPVFRMVNLIYGWNGCGKTTLTRLFGQLSTTPNSDLHYELEMTDGGHFGPEDEFPIQVRVFNQDYVQNNVRVLESSANAISILLGEQNKELITQIESDERELNGEPGDPSRRGKIQELHGYTQKKVRKEKDNDTAFSDIARTIGAAIVGSGSASRTYRSPDAKKDFAAISEPIILTDDELEVSILALKQEMLLELEPLKPADLIIRGITQNLSEVTATCLTDAKKLCLATAESEMISRLSTNQDISEWVEQGLRIHTEHKSTNCEYCGNDIPRERLSQLAKHFSDADRLLKERIDNVLALLREVHGIVRSISPYDSARLYRELQTSYSSAVVVLEEAKNHFISQVTALGQELQAKKVRAGESISLEVLLEADSLLHALAKVNSVLEIHNTKSRDFTAAQNKAIKQIKTHYLSTIFEGVTRRNQEIEELKPDLERRASDITAIRARIVTARAAISSSHRACEQINSGLKTFLGREELLFESEIKLVDNDSGGQSEIVVGYRIMRGDEPAVYLSEGEKTAIAFVYFVVHLNDGQFPKSDGIVVIDDPVSSLDSNSLYQAFSFLKNAVKDCRQVFILTHNFEFLKLLLNWRSRNKKKDTGFYMIKNHFVDGDRRATIDEMDRELKDYESEYHYLFKSLKEMREEQNGTIMRAYPVPNIARKVWEAFLMYRVPNGQNPYAKMEQLKIKGFDAQKLDAIYKFTNDQSHITGAGFDPALVPETQKVLTEMFEMMEKIAPEHFAIIDGATQIS